MAKQIEGVSEKIEKCAREEFLKNGYTDASLRTIASEAGTTTGSIYSRYGDKEGLFSAIVEPAANEFIENSEAYRRNFILWNLTDRQNRWRISPWMECSGWLNICMSI